MIRSDLDLNRTKPSQDLFLVQVEEDIVRTINNGEMNCKNIRSKLDGATVINMKRELRSSFDQEEEYTCRMRHTEAVPSALIEDLRISLAGNEKSGTDKL